MRMEGRGLNQMPNPFFLCGLERDEEGNNVKSSSEIQDTMIHIPSYASIPSRTDNPNKFRNTTSAPPADSSPSGNKGILPISS